MGLRELMGWAVGSEGTEVLEFCLMFVFGEAVSDNLDLPHPLADEDIRATKANNSHPRSLRSLI